jgi:predicted DNA binding CopG/RHH family protein
MTGSTKRIPKFETSEEEAEFWDTHSLADYWDEWQDVKGPLIDARPAKKLISIRFDPELITAAKRIAKTKGIGYQTLLRMWAYEGLAREVDGRAQTKRRAKKAG